ncbi:unnamed protein product [Penicillium nalgiovense]|nr:unnamed protein product [Penicillium nalgiovense]
MTIKWLKGGCQGALSQGNPHSDNSSTWLNGSTRPHLERIELIYNPQPQSHQDDTRKPMSTSMKCIRDQQPFKHEGKLSSHRHSSSDEQRHSAAAFPREEPTDINKRKQRTYIFKDCTFDGTSMVITGGAGSMDDTMVFHNSNTGRTFCVHGGMDTETFLREFSGKRK